MLNASLLLDGEGRILEGNRDAEVFLERPLEEVRKKPLSEANPALYSALKELMAKTRRGRGVEDYALAYKVGKRLMRLSLSVTPYPLESLGETGTLVTIAGEGGRPPSRPSGKAAEQPSLPLALEERDSLTQALDVLPEPAFILDTEVVFEYVNPRMCQIMDHKAEELAGRPVSFFVAREEAKQALQSLVEAVHAAPWRGELELRRKDGTTAHIAVTIDTLKEEGGEEAGLLGIGRDYRDEARIRREREEELKRVWTLLEKVELAVISFTPDLRVTFLSHTAEDMLGITGDRAIGARLPEIFPPESEDVLRSVLESSLDGEEARGMQLPFGGAEKGIETITIHTRPAVMAEGRPRELMMILEEAPEGSSETQRREAELEEARLRVKLLETAVESRGREDFVQRCLQLMEEDYGCSAAVAFKVDSDDLLLESQLGLGDKAEEYLRSFRLRPAYTRVCVLMQGLYIEIHGGVPGKGWDEVRSMIDDADRLLPLIREERWRNLFVFPLRGLDITGAVALAGCEPDSLKAVGMDYFAHLGEAIAMVLERLQKEVPEEEKHAPAAPPPVEEEPAAPSQAWDFPAPVVGKDEAAEERPAPDTEGEEHELFEIAREAKGVDEARDNLSLWGERIDGKPVYSPEGVELPSLLRELKDRAYLWELEGEILLELEEDLPKMHTDPLLLGEVLLQLLDNALRYSPPGTTVILGAERWGDEVLLRVEDQGPGIPGEILEAVKRAGLEEKGSEDRVGAKQSGLFKCRRYVKSLGGNLSVKGKIDEGTTVFVRLRVLPFVGEGR